MKIGFDAKRAFNNHSGLGTYSRGLIDFFIKNTSDNLYLFTPKLGDAYTPSENLPNLNIVTPTSILNKRLSSVWRLYNSGLVVNDLKLDVFHGLSAELPLGLSTSIKKVVTIHDLLFEIYPDNYPIIDRTIYSQKAKNACLRADAIVAISEVTKRDIVNYYAVDPNKITVIPVALEEKREVNLKPRYDSPYIVMVSSFMKRKNQDLLIKAFENIADKVDVDLILVGRGSSYLKYCKKLAKKSPYSKRILFVENATDRDIASFYTYAKLSVYTSLNEGFGIPILESMKYQSLLLLSDSEVHKEVAADAALYFQNDNVNDLTTQLKKALEMSSIDKEKYLKKSNARIQLFYADKVYPKYLDVY